MQVSLHDGLARDMRGFLATVKDCVHPKTTASTPAWPICSSCAALQASSEAKAAGCCNHCLKSPQKLHICTRCRCARYCGSSCQQADWEYHKRVCGLCTVQIVRSADRGRVLVAHKDFAVGDRVLVDSALLVAGDGEESERAEVAEALHPILDSAAQFAAAGRNPLTGWLVLIARFLTAAFYRSLDPRLWRWQLLCGTLEDRPAAEAENIRKAAELVMTLLPPFAAQGWASVHPHLPRVTPALLELLVCEWLCNAVALERPLGRGLFMVASMAEHSCAPNAHFATTGPHLELFAIAPIAKGAAISINYCKLYAPTAVRRAHLQASHGFLCGCPRCVAGPDVYRAFCCPARSKPAAKGDAKSDISGLSRSACSGAAGESKSDSAAAAAAVAAAGESKSGGGSGAAADGVASEAELCAGVVHPPAWRCLLCDAALSKEQMLLCEREEKRLLATSGCASAGAAASTSSAAEWDIGAELQRRVLHSSHHVIVAAAETRLEALAQAQQLRRRRQSGSPAAAGSGSAAGEAKAAGAAAGADAGAAGAAASSSAGAAGTAKGSDPAFAAAGEAKAAAGDAKQESKADSGSSSDASASAASASAAAADNAEAAAADNADAAQIDDEYEETVELLTLLVDAVERAEGPSAPRLAKFSHALAAVLASRLPSLGDDGASPGSGGSSGSSGSSGSGGGIASGGGDGESKGGKTGIALESELVCERRRLCAQLYKQALAVRVQSCGAEHALTRRLREEIALLSGSGSGIGVAGSS